MKFTSVIKQENIPVIAFMLIFVKIMHVGFKAVTQEGHTFDTLIRDAGVLVDNLAWIPMTIFIVYFYLYRVGEEDNYGLKNASTTALLAAVPKLVVLALLVKSYYSYSGNAWLVVYYSFEFVAWILMCTFIITYWSIGFKLKEHRHHHHTRHRKHRPSREVAE